MFMKFVNTIHQNVSLLGLPIEIVGADLEHCHGLLVVLGPKGGRSESIPISWHPTDSKVLLRHILLVICLKFCCFVTA